MAQLLALQPEFPASPTSAGCETDIALLLLDPHFRRTPKSSRGVYYFLSVNATIAYFKFSNISFIGRNFLPHRQQGSAGAHLQSHVLFSFCDSREEFDQEEKAKFGELCSGENTKGREWFARYVSAQVRRGF